MFKISNNKISVSNVIYDLYNKLLVLIYDYKEIEIFSLDNCNLLFSIKDNNSKGLHFIAYDELLNSIFYINGSNLIKFDLNKNTHDIWLENFTDYSNSYFYNNSYIYSKHLLFYVKDGDTLISHNLKTKEIISTLKVSVNSLYNPMAINLNTNLVALLELKNQIKVFSTENLKLLHTIDGFNSQDDIEYFEYKLKEQGQEFYPYSREYFDWVKSKLGTPEEISSIEGFIKEIIFNQDLQEVLIVYEGNNGLPEYHVKIYDTQKWILKERIYDCIKDKPVYINNSEIIVSSKKNDFYTEIYFYSKKDKKLIKTIKSDKELYITPDGTKYGYFITKEKNLNFEIRDIKDLFNE